MRQCSRCGAALTPAAIAAGKCQTCGASLTGDANAALPTAPPPFKIEPLPPLTMPQPAAGMSPQAAGSGTRWPPAGDQHGAEKGGQLPDHAEEAARPKRKRRRRRPGRLILLTYLVLGMFVLGAWAALARWPTATPSNLVSAGDLPALTPLVTTTVALTPVVALTTTPGVSKTATPRGTATGRITPTATPRPPILTVSASCYNSSSRTPTATVTVTNSGGGTMSWMASNSPGSTYTLSSQNPTLSAGQSGTITVSGIKGNGSITVTSSQAGTSSPQTVPIAPCPAGA